MIAAAGSSMFIDGIRGNLAMNGRPGMALFRGIIIEKHGSCHIQTISVFLFLTFCSCQ